jgi:hypothetical protein
MGYWKIEYWKENDKGEEVDLTTADLEHIAELIKEGYTEGDIPDGDEDE